MTNDSKNRKGVFGRVIEALGAWGNTMDYTPHDYVLDRLGNLEREVLLMRDELRALSALNTAGGRAKPAPSPPAGAR
jgi:hypothetical protein